MSRSLLAVFALLLAALNFARPWFGRAGRETSLEWVGRWLFGYGVLGTIPFVWIDTDATQGIWRVAMLVWMAGMAMFMVTAWLRRRARDRVL